MYQVTKRDGTAAQFEIGKISAAITKAFEALEKQYHPSVIDMLAQNRVGCRSKVCKVSRGRLFRAGARSTQDPRQAYAQTVLETLARNMESALEARRTRARSRKIRAGCAPSAHDTRSLY